MGTRLQGYIYCALPQQIDIADHRNCVDFGMGLAALAMSALTDNRPVGADNHCAHHGIGRRVTGSLPRQLQRPEHVFLVNYHGLTSDCRGKTHLAETILDDANFVKALSLKQSLDFIAKPLIDFEI